MELVKNMVVRSFHLLIDKSGFCHDKHKEKSPKSIWHVPHPEEIIEPRNISSDPKCKNRFAKAPAFASVDPVRFGKSNFKPEVFGHEPEEIGLNRSASKFISEDTFHQLFGKEEKHANNVLEDYLYLRLSRIFGASIRLIANLMGRTSEAVRKRLAKLQKRSEEERNAIIEVAIALGHRGKNIHISTKSEKIDVRYIAKSRQFKFNGRLLRFEVLHELFVNFDIDWFIDPNDVPICMKKFEEEMQTVEGRLLLRKVAKVRTKEEISLRHFAARLNLARSTQKDNTGKIPGKLICEISKAYQVSISKLDVLIEAHKHKFSGSILFGIVHSCRHL
jgi:hypothetical protein